MSPQHGHRVTSSMSSSRRSNNVLWGSSLASSVASTRDQWGQEVVTKRPAS